MHKVTTAAVAGVLLVPAATSTAALGATADPSVIATFDGHTINLADGWGTAHACVVLGSGSVQCYDTETDMRDALAASAVQTSVHSATSPSVTCSNPSTLVTLYASTNFGGNSLSFVSTAGWTNLAPYGFDNKMESWVNQTACNSAVADGTLGSGAQLTLAARSSAATVGTSWKDRASSINVVP
jgi:hypothetical protein